LEKSLSLTKIFQSVAHHWQDDDLFLTITVNLIAESWCCSEPATGCHNKQRDCDVGPCDVTNW